MGRSGLSLGGKVKADYDAIAKWMGPGATAAFAKVAVEENRKFVKANERNIQEQGKTPAMEFYSRIGAIKANLPQIKESFKDAWIVKDPRYSWLVARHPAEMVQLAEATQRETKKQTEYALGIFDRIAKEESYYKAFVEHPKEFIELVRYCRSDLNMESPPTSQVFSKNPSGLVEVAKAVHEKTGTAAYAAVDLTAVSGVAARITEHADVVAKLIRETEMYPGSLFIRLNRPEAAEAFDDYVASNYRANKAYNWHILAERIRAPWKKDEPEKVTPHGILEGVYRKAYGKR